MNCDRVRPLIDAYTTDELDLSAALEVSEHLEQCAVCATELKTIQDLRGVIRRPSLRYDAPPELRARLAVARQQNVGRHSRFRRLAIAAAIAALLLLPWLGIYWNALRANTSRLADDVTSSHIRSLMSDHLLDVPSTDQHTVKPWFNGKLDFSPTVVDLASDGFPLIGGRLDYIGGRSVAAVVYKRNKHTINLFLWPTASPDSQPTKSRHNGYNLFIWNRAGMTCCAVSDLNAPELEQFVQLLRTR
jgi:anti-sigma factor RsiW